MIQNKRIPGALDGSFGYYAIATYDDDPECVYHVDFTVYKVVSDDGEDGIMFEGDDFQMVDSASESETLISGFVKWEGCSNWNIGSESMMQHFCSKEEAGDIGRILEALYDWSATILTNPDWV